jgi:hypothetical protein
MKPLLILALLLCGCDHGPTPIKNTDRMCLWLFLNTGAVGPIELGSITTIAGYIETYLGKDAVLLGYTWRDCSIQKKGCWIPIQSAKDATVPHYLMPPHEHELVFECSEGGEP